MFITILDYLLVFGVIFICCGIIWTDAKFRIEKRRKKAKQLREEFLERMELGDD